MAFRSFSPPPNRTPPHLDIIAPALGVSVLLLIYYTAVGFFTIYMTTNFGFCSRWGWRRRTRPGWPPTPRPSSAVTRR